MEHLEKLAVHILDEADKLAMVALQHIAHPEKFHQHVDIVLRYCDAHQELCESIEIHEDWEEEEASDGGWGSVDNPRKKR
jgi:hypothetical protein